VRFEVALKTLDPELEVLAPVRDEAFVRAEQVKYLEDRMGCRCRRAARPTRSTAACGA
jgi:argininosuccinate synthase